MLRSILSPVAAWILLLACWQAPAFGAAPAASLDVAMREDAELADVCFVNAQLGWAVGDRGAIWHTVDAGRAWRLQESGTSARLNSVCFLDAQHGWAAGGFPQPIAGVTQGVLLRTRDGGKTWEADERLTLPTLKRVKFFDLKTGVAAGETSAMYPSGAFATDNGGKTWNPISGGASQGWLTGDFIDPLSGALAGRAGSLSAVRRQGLEPALTPGFGLRGLKQMRLDRQGRGWLVGDGALVLSTEDLGHSWQVPTGQWPEFVSQHFDWQAVASHERAVWIAGTPGAKVLHSPDAGATWQLFDTKQSLPLLAMSFVDEQHGWAVGSLGTILATQDGGRSWQRQHGGGTRAALLGLYGEGSEIPVELLARFSAAEGYLSHVSLLGRRDVEDSRAAEVQAVERAHEAVVGAGGCGVQAAWQFPLRQRGLTLSAEQIAAGWDRANDGEGLAKLEDYVVKQIRLWRPEVIFTQGPSPRGEAPLSHIVNQVVLRAAEKAGDPTRCTDLNSLVGLETWKVKKIYCSVPGGQLGGTQLETTQLAPRLSRSLADYASASRDLLHDDREPAPGVLSFRLTLNTLPGDVGERDFLSGVVLHPGGEARRSLTDPPTDSLEALRRAANKQHHVKTIIDRMEQDQLQGVQLAGQMGDLVGGLEGSAAGQLLHQMADRYHRRGQWEQAAETYELLTVRYPDHPLTPSALVWLINYYASSETAWRLQKLQRVSGVKSAPAVAGPGVHGLRAKGGTSLSIDNSLAGDRPGQAAAFARTLENARPMLAAEPLVRFPLAAAYRGQGLTKESDRIYMNLRRGRELDAWFACADAERWLLEPKQTVSPKPVWQCSPGSQKPKLDGRLDDPLWQHARGVPLRSPLRDDAEWPAVAMLAYDVEHLYLAVSCRRAAGAKYDVLDAPRTHDADLAAQDRVEFYLDLDRDWSTSYCLTVDHQGRTGESLWGDKTWNPNWYVAAAQDEGVWTVEAAIPLEELTGDFPKPGVAWAAGVQRIVPHAGFQSWTTPAAARLQGEGFGLLLFE